MKPSASTTKISSKLQASISEDNSGGKGPQQVQLLAQSKASSRSQLGCQGFVQLDPGNLQGQS